MGKQRGNAQWGAGTEQGGYGEAGVTSGSPCAHMYCVQETNGDATSTRDAQRQHPQLKQLG